MGIFDNVGMKGPIENPGFLGRIGNAAHQLHNNPAWQEIQARERGENPFDNALRRAQQQSMEQDQALAVEKARYLKEIQRKLDAGQKVGATEAFRAGISPAEFKMIQPKPQERKTAADQSGRLRYIDDQTNVFDTVGANPKDDELNFTQEKNLRGEFQDLNKSFRQQENAFGRILSSAQDPSAAGDLALIFNYMKVLDPGSTVREGEFANAQNSGGIGAKISALYNNLLKGERLTPAMRSDFVNRAVQLYKGASTDFNRRSDQYKRLAGEYGLSPNKVVSSGVLYGEDDYAPASAPPSVGQAVEGYIFLGGDPSNPESWEAE